VSCSTFHTELLVRARRLGFRVVELPVTCLLRKSETGCSLGWRRVAELWTLRRGLRQVSARADERIEAPLPIVRRVA
jgi:hypothetical protein